MKNTLPKQTLLLIAILIIGATGVWASAREIKRDGRFIAYDNGTVKDTKTGLMWASKDNGKDINWNDAKRYCENYRGGGYTDWRMPTSEEIEEFNKTSTSEAKQHYKNRMTICPTKLISLSACCLWTSETFGYDNKGAVSFDFRFGRQSRWFGSEGRRMRVLPTRSGK